MLAVRPGRRSGPATARAGRRPRAVPEWSTLAPVVTALMAMRGQSILVSAPPRCWPRSATFSRFQNADRVDGLFSGLVAFGEFDRRHTVKARDRSPKPANRRARRHAGGVLVELSSILRPRGPDKSQAHRRSMRRRQRFARLPGRRSAGC